MAELAARHGYDMQGNSLTASDDDGDEYEEDSRQGDPSKFSSESRDSEKQSGPSKSGRKAGGGHRDASPSRRAERHRGMSFENMERIFDVLVNRVSHLLTCYLVCHQQMFYGYVLFDLKGFPLSIVILIKCLKL
jgi:hypothetical protein